MEPGPSNQPTNQADEVGEWVIGSDKLSLLCLPGRGAYLASCNQQRDDGFAYSMQCNNSGSLVWNSRKPVQEREQHAYTVVQHVRSLAKMSCPGFYRREFLIQWNYSNDSGKSSEDKLYFLSAGFSCWCCDFFVPVCFYLVHWAWASALGWRSVEICNSFLPPFLFPRKTADCPYKYTQSGSWLLWLWSTFEGGKAVEVIPGQSMFSSSKKKKVHEKGMDKQTNEWNTTTRCRVIGVVSSWDYLCEWAFFTIFGKIWK